MQCRNCGAEIADKALICYRCGTPTSEAKYQPAVVRRRRSSLRWLIIAIVIAVLLLLALYFSGTLFTARRVSDAVPRPVDYSMRVLTTEDTKDTKDQKGLFYKEERSDRCVLGVLCGEFTFDSACGPSARLRLDGVA